MQQHCYKITLPTTNAAKDTYHVLAESALPGGYLDVEDGVLYFIGPLGAAAQFFPDAIEIKRLGPGISSLSPTPVQVGEEANEKSEPTWPPKNPSWPPLETKLLPDSTD